ncbi:MAG: DUF1289 domain-containing protein [Gammaproteobacteria bacterium]
MTPTVPIHSPCMNICIINAESGYCQGCFRTIEEISEWSKLPPDDRARIIQQLERRRQESGD